MFINKLVLNDLNYYYLIKQYFIYLFLFFNKLINLNLIRYFL